LIEQIKGVTALINFIGSVNKNIPKKLKAQTLKSARTVSNNAVRKVPVDTGNLRKSHFITPKTTATDIEVKIGFNAPYAPFVEFGTGGLVQVPAGFEELAINHKGNGIKKVNLKARSFLIPALLQEKENFEIECQKIVSQLGQ
jgi:HK97 gp10 family phage protein